MTDMFSKSIRSSIMSKIKSKNTKCELVLRDTLRHNGVVAFKMHYDIIGKPDIAFPQIKLAVFCDSDFWHGKSKLPKTNQQYWRQKFQRNKKRDKMVDKQLRKLGWKIIRFPEKTILQNTNECVNKILKCINYLHVRQEEGLQIKSKRAKRNDL